MKRPHVIFVRHGHTTYSGVYPDLTEIGQKQMELAAKKIGSLVISCDSGELQIESSGATRTKGSADIVAAALKYRGAIRIEPLLTEVKLRNIEAALDIFQKIAKAGKRIEQIYNLDDRFDDENIFEPRNAVKARFYEYLSNVRGRMLKNTTLCIIAVSHCEVLNHFLQSVFPNSPFIGHSDFFAVRFTDATEQLEVEYHGELKKIKHPQQVVMIGLKAVEFSGRYCPLLSL